MLQTWKCQYLVALALTVFADSALAQVALEVQPAEVQVIRAVSPTPATVAPAATPSPQSDRLSRLKSLTYDRRPSTILKAWSQPPDAEDDAANTKPTPPENPPAAAKPAQPSLTEQQKAEAEKQAVEKRKLEAEQKKLAAELKELQRNVTLSRWPEVKAYLATLPENEGKEGYAQMVRSLMTTQVNPTTAGRGVMVPGGSKITEVNVFQMADIFGLIAACPHKLEKETLQLVGAILRLAIQAGLVPSEVAAKFTQESERPSAEALLSRRQCAQLLSAAGQNVELGPFLPPLAEAVTANDAEAITLLARHQMALQAKLRKPELLEDAWRTLQAALALHGADKKAQEEALQMAVDLAPKVKKELGQAWLEQSFTDEIKRGMKILSTIGSLASTGLTTQPHSPDSRLQALRLQKTAADALLKAAPERAKEWSETMALLALAWHREAEFSRLVSRATSYGPRMQRDPWGNFYYVNDEDVLQMHHPNQENRPQPISVNNILEVAPSDAWLSSVDAAMQPRFQALFAQLYLKVAEDERAFPYIERLATTHPDLAQDLAHEFIRVWTSNHDPNAGRRYSNPYIFMYGYEQKAESIPLTRSKQERNLTELAEWVKRLRALPLKELDEGLLVNAFTNSHSSAEVYDLAAIDRVFGSIDALKPKAIADLVQQMRQNLGGQWRMPAEQEKKKTRRKQKDVEAEVLRGYRVAGELLARAFTKYPDDWRLTLAQACLTFDENSFQHELKPDSTFSHRRLDALARFRKAAELYANQVGSLREDEQTTLVYEHWFYAGLGASDLGRIDHKSTPDDRQPPLILAALQALPGETAKRHQDLFANTLFTRMSAMKPTVKFRYLKAGFEIVGDHKQAREARKLYDYYKDLVTEIKLVTRIDGPAAVGAKEPFGVFVELNHTREIERESGGFARYLQNQQGNLYFSYNYGRPLENYRDKFEEAVRAALAENFDVLSVTFQAEDVGSRALQEAGWRAMPYAYLLLKARGPQIDKLPALKMDLDFLDTSGYVLLPITSPALPLDASKQPRTGRPCEKLDIIQTLDERQAADGKMVIEVKATGHGLVPSLEDLVDLRFPEFTITDTEDQGLTVSKFDPESSEPVVISERTWLVSLAGRKDLTERPKTFEFPKLKADGAQVTYQRYQDADLATVERVVSLEQQYGDVRRPWVWAIAALAPLGLAAVFAARALSRRRRPQAESRFALPETITPFTVLSLLRNIATNDGLCTADRKELATSIDDLERHYFADSNGDREGAKPDLQGIAETWSRRTIHRE
jgi:hypothetical protein